VLECAIVSMPDPQWGEVGLAIVAAKPGQRLTEADVFAHCAANLARFKCPRQVRFVEALPRNATGKIHKPTLRKEFSVTSEVDKKAANA
jgi:fatty-acyl-CoA synthase